MIKRSSVFCFCLLLHPQSCPKSSRDGGQLWHSFKWFPWIEVSPGRWRWGVHFKERHIFHQLPVFPSNQMAAEKSSLEVKIQSCKTQLSLATRRSHIAQVGIVSWFFYFTYYTYYTTPIGCWWCRITFQPFTSVWKLPYVKVLAGPVLGFWRRLGVNYSSTTLRKGHNFTCWTVCCFVRAFFQRSELYSWPTLSSRNLNQDLERA